MEIIILITNLFFWIVIFLFLKSRLSILKKELSNITKNKIIEKQEKIFIIFYYLILLV